MLILTAAFVWLACGCSSWWLLLNFDRLNWPDIEPMDGLRWMVPLFAILGPVIAVAVAMSITESMRAGHGRFHNARTVGAPTETEER